MLKDMLYITAGGFLTIKDRVQKELNALENRGKIDHPSPFGYEEDDG